MYISTALFQRDTHCVFVLSPWIIAQKELAKICSTGITGVPLHPDTADPTKPVRPPDSSDSRPRQAPLCSGMRRRWSSVFRFSAEHLGDARWKVPAYYAHSMFISGYMEYFTDMRQRWGRGPTPRHLKTWKYRRLGWVFRVWTRRQTHLLRSRANISIWQAIQSLFYFNATETPTFKPSDHLPWRLYYFCSIDRISSQPCFFYFKKLYWIPIQISGALRNVKWPGVKCTVV